WNRRAHGKTALCIHWGMWAEAGMAARAHAGDAPNARRRDWKATSLTTEDALNLQDRLVAEDASVAIVTRTDWDELARDPAYASMPLLSSLAPSSSSVASAEPVAVTGAAALDRGTLEALSAAERVERLTGYLTSAVEGVLALDENALGADEPLDTVGYDSLSAVDLQMRIAKELDLDVPLLALLQRGTARDLASRVARQLGSAAPVERAPSMAPAAPAVPVERPIQPNEVSASSIVTYAARTPTLPPATHTNSYALGSRDVVLVEPATPFEAEQRAWIEWVRGLQAAGRRPVAIFATHHHDDHVGGLDVLSRELGVPVWMHEETWARVGGPKPGRLLVDGDTFELDGPTRERWNVLHTPGHAPGHLCLWNADSKTIIAGDMIASVGTILIAPGDGDMQSYLAGLERLAGLGAACALPAHGPAVLEPTEVFRSLIRERQTREHDVLRALVDVGPQGGTAENLVGIAYRDTSPHTWPIGILSLQSHLEKLQREGRVVENAGRYRAVG
ncbi:MAG TPA: MBL fold metallo-hydrolase, partial [Byssovorax sp.]